ncbi:MAG: cytochrome P450 [Acidimicrobiia bacterium]
MPRPRLPPLLRPGNLTPAVTHAFDPFDPGQAQRAWPLLAELRRAGPVAALTGGMHYVCHHAECTATLRDTDAFSNASGMKAPGVEIPFEDRILGELDPPRHSVVRRVMVTALTPKVVHGAEPFIRDTAAALLDAMPETGTADLVTAFTVPLPNRVTVHLLGFPPADADMIASWAKELMESAFPRTNRTDRGEGFVGAFPDFAGYIDDKVDRRVDELARDDEVPDDVLTRLVRLEVDGAHLTRRQLRALTRNLITGGLTTTSQLLGNLVYELLTVPGLEDAVRGERAALDRAIEESLRIAPPVLFVARGCVRDTAIGDTPVRTGERVIVGTGSANRDERIFDDADAFRVDRANADQHLTFGYGPHVCPGAALARVVARIGIAALLDRFPPGSVRLAPGYEFENVPTFFEIGPRRLPVEVTVATP